MDELDQQFEELREAMKTLHEQPTASVTIGSGYESASSYPDTITLSGGLGATYSNTTVNGGGYSVTGIAGQGFTYNNGTGVTWANPISTNSVMNAGKLELNGENADIEINGVSLLEVLQERLNVLIPNPKLEKEWAQLKELGDQYRALEKKLKEQSKMWEKLKKMPPPDPLS